MEGPQDFSVSPSPSPMGNNWVFELVGTWLGLGFGGLGSKDYTCFSTNWDLVGTGPRGRWV